MGKRELVALLNLSSWCLVINERLFLAMPWGCLRFVIVVFPEYTHLLFFIFFVFNDSHLSLNSQYVTQSVVVNYYWFSLCHSL